MSWLYLLAASAFEIGFAISLKYTDGFTRFLPCVVTLLSAAMSLIFLSQALKTLPLGTAYAVWTGIGSAGAAVLGIYLFHEPRDLARILSIVLILCGILGLKLTSRF
ncbi:MAG TPA: multidrug efflux SMR transporter [Anaerolineales bacterium]|nr:multidrug efflux SMR transporter [Anaerolineales bacterium]